MKCYKMHDERAAATKARIIAVVGEERWRCLAVHSAVARVRKLLPAGQRITCKMRRSPSGRPYGEYTLVVERQEDADCPAPCA